MMIMMMMMIMTIGATLLGPNLEMKVHATRVVTQTHLANFRARPFDIFFSEGEGGDFEKHFQHPKARKSRAPFLRWKNICLVYQSGKTFTPTKFSSPPSSTTPPPPKKKESNGPLHASSLVWCKG